MQLHHRFYLFLLPPHLSDSDIQIFPIPEVDTRYRAIHTTFLSYYIRFSSPDLPPFIYSCFIYMIQQKLVCNSLHSIYVNAIL